MSGDVTTLEAMPVRLQAAARELADAREAYNLALAARNELVVQAVDEGMPQGRVADAIGTRQSQVTRILAGSEAEAVLPRA